MDTLYNNICDACGISACIFVGTDPHQLEYPLQQFKLRHYLSGFHGSAGTFVICKSNDTIDKAIWTDGRYEIAARVSASSDTHIFISQENNWREQIDWIGTRVDHTQEPIIVGIPSIQITAKNFSLIQEVASKSPYSIRIVEIDYADILHIIKERDTSLWNTLMEKPLVSSVTLLSEMQAQHPIESLSPIETSSEKLHQLSQYMKAKHADIYTSTNAHELSWLTNLRSQVIEFLMIVPALFVFHVSKQALHIWIPSYLLHAFQCDMPQLEDKLQASIILHNYDECISNPANIQNMLISECSQHKSILCDANNIPQSLFHNSYQTITSPLTLWKSIRTDTEIQHIKHIHSINAIALVEAAAEISEACLSNNPISEKQAADIVLAHKAKSPYFLQLSFHIISAKGGNAAIPHYSGSDPSPSITPNDIFLLDCGAHYLYGTTDITRVYHFGSNEISQEFKETYTHVLRAHIALAQYNIEINPNDVASFPTGKELDAVGRAKLLEHHKNFNHGIGHGLGYCTDVHEGVQAINSRTHQHFYPNMLVSNEPGYYKEAEWGIRIENIILSKVAKNKFYFETISYMPIQTSLIDFTLMNDNEKSWLHTYHEHCTQCIFPHLSQRAKQFFNTLI